MSVKLSTILKAVALGTVVTAGHALYSVAKVASSSIDNSEERERQEQARREKMFEEFMNEKKNGRK